MNLIIFDLETTGLSPRSNEIIQIAAVKMRSTAWDDTETFDTFVRPQGRISGFITGLTGITQARVAQAPTPAQALMSFSRGPFPKSSGAAAAVMAWMRFWLGWGCRVMACVVTMRAATWNCWRALCSGCGSRSPRILTPFP